MLKEVRQIKGAVDNPPPSPKGKKPKKKNEPFYQAVVDSRRPKKSKLERVFGEDAVKIEREARELSRTGGKSGKKSTRGPKKK